MDQLNTYIEGAIAAKIPKIAEELVREFEVSADDGRKNELTIEVRRSLTGIAARIDRGFNIQVTCNPPATDAIEGEGAERQAIESYLRIQNAGEGMKYIKLDGPPILELPDRSNASAANAHPAPGTRSPAA